MSSENSERDINEEMDRMAVERVERFHSVFKQLHDAQAKLAELEADNKRLREACEKALEKDGGNNNADDDSDLERVCCGSGTRLVRRGRWRKYELGPHASDCWVPAIRAALSATAARTLASEANAEAKAKGGAQ